MMLTRFTVLTLALLACGVGQTTVLVNFDCLNTSAGPVVVGSTYEAYGVRFEGLFAASSGLPTPHWCTAQGAIPISSPNVGPITLVPPFGTTSILAVFIQPATGGAAVTDFVEWNMCDTEIGTTMVTVTLLNAYGLPLLVQSYTTPPQQTLQISHSIPGIAAVLMSTDRDGGSIDDFRFHAVTSAPPGQGNALGAQLSINGIGGLGLPGPFSVAVGQGSTIALDWLGPPNRPLLLGAGPGNTSMAALGCSGILHVGTPPTYSDLVIVLDGTQPGFPGALFQTSGAGTSSQTFAVPALPPGLLTSLQGAIIQPPGSTCPIVLAAAFHIIII
jgi:hypothetical protein